MPAADVENAGAGRELVVGGHLFGDGEPAAIVAVAAIAGVAVAVPILDVEFFGEGGEVGLVAREHAPEVVTGRAAVHLFDEVEVGHGEISGRGLAQEGDRGGGRADESEFFTGGKGGNRERLAVGAGEDEAGDAVGEAGDVEVDEEADGHIEELHVAEELGLVDW